MRATIVIRHRPALGLLAFVLLFAAGCGLSEYEKAMDVERKRIDDFDLQNKYLGDPIRITQERKGEAKKDKKEVSLPPARLSVRPPKEVTSKRGTEGSLLQVYDAGTGAEMMATFQKLYIGVAVDMKQADFRNAVLGPFRISGSAQPGDVNIQSPNGTVKRFQMLHSEVQAPMGTATLSIYFYDQAPYQAALIFKVLKSKATSDTDKAIELCLRSLTLG